MEEERKVVSCLYFNNKILEEGDNIYIVACDYLNGGETPIIRARGPFICPIYNDGFFEIDKNEGILEKITRKKHGYTDLRFLRDELCEYNRLKWDDFVYIKQSEEIFKITTKIANQLSNFDRSHLKSILNLLNLSD